ncbi:hypothetical protein HRG14_07160 [Paenibacillus dendritiformis]|nr:hypothetical protein [Paenibacillus dendritiformis]
MQRLELGGGVRLYTDHAAGYRQWRRYAAPQRPEAAGAQPGVDVLWLQAPEAARQPDTAAGIGPAGGGRMFLNRHAGPWSGPAMRERLRLWGLPVLDRAAWGAEPRSGPDGAGFVRTVCFWVSQLEAVAAAHCFQSPTGGYFYRPLEGWTRPPYLRLARLAVRAVYALGRDTGAVTLRCRRAADETDGPAGVLEEPRPGDAIERVEPVPAPLPAWVLESYAASWAKAAAEQQSARARPGKLLIGLDAELVLHDARRRKLIAASRYLPRGGRAGCDAVRIGGRVRFPLMELRPDPAPGPEELVHHIAAAMEEARLCLEASEDGAALEWLAGGLPLGRFPLGGHIHLSGLPLTSEFARVLDTYVALPVAALEDPSGAPRRPRYGTFGDVRLQEHGGAGGFEYRTLPSFLLSPELAREVLALLHAAARLQHRLKRRDSLRDPVIRAYHAGRPAEELLPVARAAVQGLMAALEFEAVSAGAPTGSGEELRLIRSFARRIDSGWRWNEREDIRHAWAIRKEGLAKA